MDVAEAIAGRRSIRSFTNRPLPEEAAALLAEAVKWAPSAGNLQSRRFYFVTGRELRMRIATASLSQMFIAGAPLVVVACAHAGRIAPYGRRGAELYAIQDVAAAVENLMLQAHALGLGSTWVGSFDGRAISEALGLEPEVVPQAVVPVGWPAESPSAPQRLPMDELVTIID